VNSASVSLRQDSTLPPVPEGGAVTAPDCVAREYARSAGLGTRPQLRPAGGGEY
jgi:hypothetical protein